MLTVSNLNQYYGSSHTLRDVSFDVPAGAVTALLGRNGVGKTTLLKCLMGVLPVRSGSVAFDGRDITGMPSHLRVRHGIGYVPQGREIFPRLTVEENLLMGLASKANGAARDIPGEVFEMFPVLRAMLRRRGGDLSGGQQQQLAIARALVGEPKVLLLDEPTEGIQPNVIQQIGAVLRRLVETRNMTVVLVEQYLDFVKEFGKTFYVMNRGRVVADGPTTGLDAELVGRHLGV